MSKHFAEKKQSVSQRALLRIRELKSELAAIKQQQNAPIAIIGMACRFPKSIQNPNQFWSLLLEKMDCITEIPEDRWNTEEFYHPDPAINGKMYVRHGGFLQQIDQFDFDFYGIPKREADSMDPQQRLLLQLSWEALEDANINPIKIKGSKTGVYVGVCTQDYARFSLCSNHLENIDIYSFTGNASSIAGGRISNILDLQGPNISIDTACSSSLVAVHQAIQSLRTGETELALAGGVNVMLSPENFIYFCKVNALSPDARCKTFDDSANGYVRAEGCGVVVLKRLDNALQNGDPIHAVILGSAINQDGKSYGLTAPNGTAQQALIQQALYNANVTAKEIAYVEAHGTGTSLGDPIEINALAKIYGQDRKSENPLLVGAVKTNLGHTEAASGMAGLIKTILCLKHKSIPPNLHFNNPNKKIDWDNTGICIVTQQQSWPEEYLRSLAAVSAFGFSGTNAHLILEAAPKLNTNVAKTVKPTQFKPSRCWIKNCNTNASNQKHPILGNRLYLAMHNGPCFESIIDINNLSYFRSHPVHGKTTMSGSGYIEIILSAAQRLFGEVPIIIENIVYQKLFVIPENTSIRLQTIFSELVSNQSLEFYISSLYISSFLTSESWTKHAIGQLKINKDNSYNKPFEKKSIIARCPKKLNSNTFYNLLSDNGYYYGIDHQGVAQVWLGEGEVLGVINIPETVQQSHEKNTSYIFHPAFLDSAYQLLLLLLPSQNNDEMYVTLSKSKVMHFKKPTSKVWVHTKRNVDNDNTTIKADVFIYDIKYNLVLVTLGYVMKRTPKNDCDQFMVDNQKHYLSYYDYTWNILKLKSEYIPQINFLIVADKHGYSDALCHELSRKNLNFQSINNADQFKKISDNNFECNLNCILDLEKLLNILNTPCHILYCSSLDNTCSESRLNQVAITPLLNLIKLLIKHNLSITSGITAYTYMAHSLPGSSDIVNPIQACYWGFAQVVREEIPQLNFHCIDIQTPDDICSSLQFLEFEASSQCEPLKLIRDQICYIPRLKKNTLSNTNGNFKQQHSKLKISDRGNISSLQWEKTPIPEINENDIKIQVMACGLNLRDVIDALGLHPRRLDEFGLECSGIITAVGDKVDQFQIGDEVIAFGQGCLGQYYTSHQNQVVKKPSSFNFEQAASIPIVFLTAYYALYEIGNIKEGEKVLIHAAAGGVGIAAVQLALLAGAEVYATASDSKWDLLKKLGVRHIMSSRNLGFYKSIMQLTKGQGVDIVLNSLADDFIEKSIKLVRKNGRFVEIGLKGITLSKMNNERPDIDYHIVNLMAKWESDSLYVKGLLNKIINLISKNKDLKLLSLQTFNYNQVIDAFRYMQQAKHQGKIIIKLNQLYSPINNGACVITGGLGALSKLLTRHLISEGYQNIALIGRSEPDIHQIRDIESLSKTQTTVKYFQADVSNYSELQHVLVQIRQEMHSIHAIYHTAGVALDTPVTDLDEKKWQSVLQPKVQGTYNLHLLTLNDPIQTFVLFSSMVSMIGSKGVANYAAANAFLNAFAHFRIHSRLPCHSIAWGPWAEAGMFHSLPDQVRNQLIQQGLETIDQNQGMEYLFRILQQPSGVYGAFSADWKQWARSSNTFSLFELLTTKNIDNGNKKDKASSENSLLKRITTDPNPKGYLCDFLQKEIADVLAVEKPEYIATQTGFFELGMDSLTSVELRNRLQSHLDCNLSATVIFDYPTIEKLADNILPKLIKTHENCAELKKTSQHKPTDDFIKTLKHMSDEDVLLDLMN